MKSGARFLIAAAMFVGCAFQSAPVAVAAEPTAADGPLLPVGVARIDITPDGPIRLCGYAVRQKESEGVAERIWVKALAIGSDADGPCVIATAEVVGVPGSLVDRVAERLQRRVGLPRARLAVCTTHTHTGPCVTGVAPHIFAAPLPPDQQARVDHYTQQLAERLEQVVLAALADRKPARLLFGQGKAGFAMNRRAIRNGRWVGMRPNPDGPVDHVPDRGELEARLKGPKRTAYYARVLLDRLDRGETLPDSFPYPVQTWRFGDDLLMVVLAGEVVVDYALRLKRQLGPDRTWVTAHANAAPCYIASARVIREGGYEVDESMNTYDKPTRLSVAAEELIINTACELLGEPK